MSKEPVVRKERPMIRLTLSPAVQTNVMKALHKLNIHETYPVQHVVTTNYHSFAAFIAECAKHDVAITLKQLNIEMIDLNKQPIRTVVKYRDHSYNEEQPING
jgi:Tfp pilus assembly protein PilO